MKKISWLILLTLSLVVVSYGQEVERPAWNVTLEEGKNARSTLTVLNRCQGTHNFNIQTKNAPFLILGSNSAQVAGGQNSVLPVQFNTNGLAPKVYNGEVLVICLTCKSEPTCTQDREVLPVILNITARKKTEVPAQTRVKNPCELIKESCEDLRIAANRAESEAAGAQDVADEVAKPAKAAEKAANDAEERAKNAEEAAKDDPSDYKARVNEQEYSSADVAYRQVLQSKLNEQVASGAISTAEYQRRTKENTTKKAREERLRNKAELKKEAEKAKSDAEAARKAADAAKAAADAAQKAADEARKRAEAARKAYDECVNKIKEECRKFEEAKAKADAERKKLEEKAKADARAAAELEKKKKEAEEREKARAREQAEYDKYLLDNMKQLGLIDSRGIQSEIAGIYDWLPTWLQTPASMLAEAKTNTPIPADTLKALAGLYGIVGKMLDPCTGKGMSKTVERLQTMTNPKTGKNYTFDEAFKKTGDMCKLMRRIKSKLEEIRRIQKTK